MTLEHIAIWTHQLEVLKAYYEHYFDGKANDRYTNESTGFQSYFIRFASGARLELMYRPGIPVNLNDVGGRQHLGLIHLAFGVASMAEVDRKARQLEEGGYPILRGPRRTGDGYYEFETLDPEGNRLEVTTLFIE
jgi:lactoylglutathione lyase